MTELARRKSSSMVDADTLRYLGLDPDDVASRALVLVADRYRLDPLLGEIRLIGVKGAAAQVYVTRDGLVAIAHRSGQLDGIVVEEMRRNTTNDGWTAYVAVYRKDCGHPFRYGAQCKDTEPQARAGYGLEQAVARGERRALKRAFAVTAADLTPAHGVTRPDQVDDVEDAHETPPYPVAPLDVALEAPATAEGAAVQSSGPVHRRAGDWTPSDQDQADARSALVNWPIGKRVEFLGRYRIERFDGPWPPEAVAEILVGSAGGRAGDPADPPGRAM